MWSNILNGNRVANDAFTKSQTPARSLPAAHGLKPSLLWLSQKSLFVSALLQPRLYWAQNSEYSNNVASSLNQLSHLTSWRQFTHLQSSAPRMTKPGTRKSGGSSMILEQSRG